MGWCRQTAPSDRARLVLTVPLGSGILEPNWHETTCNAFLFRYGKLCILSSFFGSFPFDLWWCLHLAHGYFLAHLFCLGSCQFGGLNCSIQGLGVFLCTDLLTCLENLNRVGTWVLCRTLSYFSCHLFAGLMLFWFYHFNLFPGHNCRAHWSKFPGLPIDF